MLEGRNERMDRAVGFGGAMVAVHGAAWLALWVGGIAGRWSSEGVLIPKTNMALCLLLAGLSLLLSSGRAPTLARRWTAGVLAALVLVISGLTFGENLFGLDLGIDQFLATELPGAPATLAPNRFGVPGSASLMLLGAGLMALAVGRRKRVPYIGLAVLLINLTPLVGFLYGIVEFYSQPRLTGIAWPTVLSMLTLGIGLMVAVHDSGPMVVLRRADSGGALLRRLLPSVILIPLVLGFVALETQRTGFFSAASATGLLALSVIIAYSVIAWSSAAHLSRSEAARVTAETSLRASEEEARRRLTELETLYESAPLGLALLDTDLRYVRVNGRLAEFNGFPAADHIGRTIREMVPTLADQIEPLMQRLLDTGAPLIGLEIRGETAAAPSVGRVWAQNLFPVRDPAGNVVSVGVTIQEITEQKRTEDQLRGWTATLEQRVAERTADLVKSGASLDAERRRFVEVLDSLPAYVILLTPDYHVQFMNREFRERFGESGGRCCFDFLFGRAEPCDICETFKVLQTGAPHRWEWTGPDGREYEISDFPFTDVDGAHLILEMGLDVTERKQAERRVAERTAETTALSGQLRELAAELTMTEHRERQRLAKVLHDHIQQLLVAAKLHTDILVSRQTSEALAASARLVNDLLEQTLLASRSLTAELSPPILHEGGLGPALQWLARGLLEKHGLAVEVAFEPSGEPLVEDLRVFLFEAVRELLFNTVKHAGVSKARVEVALAPDGRIRVVVSDDGAGFAPTEVRRTSSGGFGLFSIQQRLQHLGGRLDLDSGPGRGTRVTLVGPPAPQPVHAAAAPVAGVASVVDVAVPRPVGQRICVVLADDHNVMRQGLASLLRAEPDIDVVGEASDGAEAIELARRLRPDVVVMDVSMPGMTGIEATRVITRDLQGVRVVGLSMHEDGEMASAMREAGAVGYVTKGGPSDVLVSTIRAACLPS